MGMRGNEIASYMGLTDQSYYNLSGAIRKKLGLMIIGGRQILASKKSVSTLEGIDKKAFTDFLKSEKISWKNPDDLLKVIEFITD